MGIKTSRRLVEEHHIWVVHQCRGNSEPLLLPTRQLVNGGVRSVSKIDLFQQFEWVHSPIIKHAKQVEYFL